MFEQRRPTPNGELIKEEATDAETTGDKVLAPKRDEAAVFDAQKYKPKEIKNSDQAKDYLVECSLMPAISNRNKELFEQSGGDADFIDKTMRDPHLIELQHIKESDPSAIEFKTFWKERLAKFIERTGSVVEELSQRPDRNQAAKLQLAEVQGRLAELQACANVLGLESENIKATPENTMRKFDRQLTEDFDQIKRGVNYIQNNTDEWSRRVMRQGPTYQYLNSPDRGAESLIGLTAAIKSRVEAISDLSRKRTQGDGSGQQTEGVNGQLQQELMGLVKARNALSEQIDQQFRFLAGVRRKAEDAGLRRDEEVCADILTALKRAGNSIADSDHSLKVTIRNLIDQKIITRDSQ